MLHGNMELVDLSGMLVGPPFRHEPYMIFPQNKENFSSEFSYIGIWKRKQS